MDPHFDHPGTLHMPMNQESSCMSDIGLDRLSLRMFRMLNDRIWLKCSKVHLIQNRLDISSRITDPKLICSVVTGLDKHCYYNELNISHSKLKCLAGFFCILEHLFRTQSSK